MKQINKVFVEWDEINMLVSNIADDIIGSYPNIDSVLGIPRGGLIPAVLLSHKLDIPLVSVASPNTLILDDICDSGKTLEDTPGVYTATLLHKPHTSTFTPNIIGMEILHDSWIVFPWESDKAEAIQDYLKN